MKKILKNLAAIFGFIFGVIYILNPTAGFFELLPDKKGSLGRIIKNEG